MTNTSTGGVNIESIIHRLLESRWGEKADKYDAMIVISLVNLTGIISAINKHWAAGPSRAENAGEDPLLGALFKMLAEGQTPQAGRTGPSGINPALLLSLLGSRGQRPETALLLAVLNNIMQPPQGSPPGERSRQPFFPRPEGPKAPAGEKKVEGGQGNVLTWDRRLG